ncbi:phage tail termination protein, partial [Enterobacter hormaechei]
MTPMMHERVRNLFGGAGLTSGFIIQQLMFDDPKDLSKAVMVFRPNGGANIRNELGSEYHVLVDVIGAKDKSKAAADAVQRIVDYVQDNPISDS